jgi:hypothetical protein
MLGAQLRRQQFANPLDHRVLRNDPPDSPYLRAIGAFSRQKCTCFPPE